MTKKSIRIELFSRLMLLRMVRADVNACLNAPQGEFLQIISDGASEYLGHQLTRVEFAKMAQISNKAVYSYFASPDARDYRTIPDELRIAIIWRVTTYVHNSMPPRVSPRPSSQSTARFYIVNGELLSLNNAAEKLGYPSPKSLAIKIKRENIQYGADISGLKYTPRVEALSKFFIVNGVKMNMGEAARALGYTITGLSLRLKKEKIQPGADISTFTRKNKKISLKAK